MQSYAWWQLTLQLVINVLLAAGVAGLVTAGWRALRPSRRSPRTLALTSLATLTLGAASWSLTTDLRAPRQSEISTPTRFSSNLLGAGLDAPPGWRLEHEGATLTAIKGEHAVDEAPANLVLTSTVVQENRTLDEHVESFRQGLKQQGLEPRESFRETVGGQPAPGFAADGDRARVAGWMIKRGPRWLLLVECFTRDGSDPRTACKAPQDRLKLWAPSDPKARQ